MTRRSMRPVCAILFFVSLAGSRTLEAATIVAQQGDAAIAHDAGAGTWSLAAGGATLTLALDPSRDFAIVSLTSASGDSWVPSSTADSFIRIGSRSLAFGSRAAGFNYRDA